MKLCYKLIYPVVCTGRGETISGLISKRVCFFRVVLVLLLKDLLTCSNILINTSIGIYDFWKKKTATTKETKLIP